MRFWMTAAALATTGTLAGATAPDQSLRPAGRPGQQGSIENQLAAAEISLRPISRPGQLGAAPEEAETLQPVASNSAFQAWINGFRSRAAAQGISTATFNQAFRGVEYDNDVIRRDRNQSEFTKTLWEYLDSAVSDSRVSNGRAALRQHRSRLNRIEATYGVDKEVVLAVWGMESNYGNHRGNMDVIQSLATLAYDGRRGRFFEQQLIAALKILQAGDVAPRKMTGSWAGAMGHTQFIPTSYLAYAVDFTGDGKRDIWSDDPSDALASTAAYLKRFGWVKGQPWGVEVKLPRGFNYSLASRSIKKSPADWARLGVTGMDGRPVPNHGTGALLLPAGANGPAFMVFKNFSVIERYNAADAYVIGVGHLSDRISGAGEFQAKWPRGDRSLTFRERQELQRRLTRAGFNTGGVDGKIGPNTLAAIRAYQSAKGLVPDGFASLGLLKHLR